MLFRCQLKAKILRKTLRITLDRLVEYASFNTIQHGQITIQDDLHSSNRMDSRPNVILSNHHGRLSFDQIVHLASIIPE